MKTSWKVKQKRIAAGLMIALIAMTTISYGSIKVFAESESDASEIVLAKKADSYAVTANVETSDGSNAADAGVVTTGDKQVKAVPNEGYEITAVTVKKDDSLWTPENAGDDWWKNQLDGAGAFSYELADELDADYEFTVAFAQKQFTITYTIGNNGKLVLNSAASSESDMVEITTEQGDCKIPYTNSEYKITAAVTDNKYHLTGLKVDGTEQINSDAVNNDLKQKEYTFTNMKESHIIEVTVQIDTFLVEVTKNEGGIIAVNGSEGLSFHADIESDVTIVIKPAEEKKIKSLTVNNTDIAESDVIEKEDGTLQYTISGIDENKVVDVQFSDILNENSNSLKDAGFVLLDGNGVELVPDNEGMIYTKLATLKSLDGKKIRLTAGSKSQSEIRLNGTTTINRIYKGGFFSMEKIEIYPQVKVVVDEDVPRIELAEEERTIWKTENTNEVDLTGKVVEDNLKKVVWSATELVDDSAILAATQEADLETKNNKFKISNVPLTEGQNADKIYIYAIDKVNQCSNAGVVTIYRDSVAPEITEVSMLPSDTVKHYEFGNYCKGNIILSIKARDVAIRESICDYPAVGVKEIHVYGEDENRFYTGTVNTGVRGTTEAVIEVLIPAEDEGVFANLQEVHVKAVDVLGNESKAYKLKDIAKHDGITSDKLMLDNSAPIVEVKPQVDGKYEKAGDNQSEYWYAETPEICYTATDKKNGQNESGLAARKVTLNGTEITSKNQNFIKNVTNSTNLVYEDAIIISSDDLGTMTDGANMVETTYTDIAGNKKTEKTTICLDTHKPEITSFTLEKKDNLKLLKFLTFGTYGNEAIKVTVHASDTVDNEGNTVPSSGLKEITIYYGDGESQTKSVESNNAAVFELPADEVLNEEKVYLNTMIQASATDNVGNQSDKTLMTTENSNVKNSNLMIETVKPVITSVLSAEGYMKGNGNVYYNGDTGFNIEVKDTDSGIYKVTVNINDKEFVNAVYDNDKKIVENYLVNTKDASINTDTNRYDLTITVIDNAGNQYSQVQRVYKDTTPPEIISIDMEASGYKEGDSSVFYTETDYGYYFAEDTKVTVFATDGSKEGDSGVKEIHYYTVDVNGTKSSEQVEQVDTNGNATFVIKAGFKGQIYACAYDMLGNHEEKFVNSDGLIIETAERHAGEQHVGFSRPATTSKDSKGNDLYEKDVNVDLTVTDTFSGIRAVEWTVESPYDKKNNQTGRIEINNNGELASGNTDGWSKTKTEKNLVTELRKTLTVKNNSNEIKVHVKIMDRAGNSSEDEIKFSIDKTKPVIKVTFDNETPDADNITMFKESRTATIMVIERNFDVADFKADITNTDGVIPELSSWQTTESAENPDQNVNTATITFSEDGDYTFTVSGQDKAKNHAETVKTADFTIDKTRPGITVTFDNNNAINGNYYAEARTATIKIEEHNFSENRVKITGTANDNGAAISFPKVSSFSGTGDVHIATITCETDGLYNFNVEYTDMAGNIAEEYIGEEYYVDMTEPEIEITGVEDYSANNGDVIPKITMSDTNFDVNGVDIELVGANQGSVAPEGSYSTQGNGETFTFRNFPKERGCDDIYTITATMTDMAGNESNATLTFSVNRFGSVYVFDQSLKDIEGTYIQNEIDVKLKEVNVDSLEHDKIKVVVDANGTPKTLEEGTDYQVKESGGNGQWYQYDYTIDKSLFAGDGRYIVTLYSEDAAGNVNENIDE